MQQLRKRQFCLAFALLVVQHIHHSQHIFRRHIAGNIVGGRGNQTTVREGTRMIAPKDYPVVVGKNLTI